MTQNAAVDTISGAVAVESYRLQQEFVKSPTLPVPCPLPTRSVLRQVHGAGVPEVEAHTAGTLHHRK